MTHATAQELFSEGSKYVGHHIVSDLLHRIKQMYAATAHQNENAESLARLYVKKYRPYKEAALSVIALPVVAWRLFKSSKNLMSAMPPKLQPMNRNKL